MSPDLAEELLALAVRLAEEAGDLLLEYASPGDLDVETKTSATDPVSEADHAAEDHITAGILAARPDDGILGEEDAANRRGTTGLTWVVDPLDGTVNFLYAIPAWCVSICCRDEEGGLVGVVRDPSHAETFTAVRGGGAWLNGRQVTVNDVADLSRALISTGFSYEAEVRQIQGAWAADLLGRARDLRRAGAAALDLAWTAAGRYDAFYEFGLKPWDWAAGSLLVEEAGGRISSREIEVGGRRGPLVAAGAPAVHEQLVAWIDEVIVGS